MAEEMYGDWTAVGAGNKKFEVEAQAKHRKHAERIWENAGS